MYLATHFLSTQNLLGEGALWSPEEEALYWVDIEGQCFFRYFLADKRQETFEAGDMIGVLAPRESGGLMMATRHGFASWDFQTNELIYLKNPEAGQTGKRFNDGGIDCQGRFWANTMDIKEPRKADGALYRFDADGSVHLMDSGFTIPNGIVW